MKKVLNSWGAGAHRLIRMLYLAVIIVLAIFAFRTWQQLQALRSAPVALPNFWFRLTGEPGQLRIVANGTWLPAAPSSNASAAAPAPLQTSSIVCNQARMQCLESVAKVESLMQRAFMEAQVQVYDIERWDAAEVVTRPLQVDRCQIQVLTFNLSDTTVTAQVSLPGDVTESMCKGNPAGLKLQDGSNLLERMKN